MGRINPESLYQRSPIEEKPEVRVGKIDTRNLFKESAAEETVPTPVSVGRLNTRNLFQEPAPEEKPRIKVGKIKPKTFLPDRPPSPEDKCEVVVGKIIPGNLFPAAQDQAEIKFYKPAVKPKKMKIDQVFPQVQEENHNHQEQFLNAFYYINKILLDKNKFSLVVTHFLFL